MTGSCDDVSPDMFNDPHHEDWQRWFAAKEDRDESETDLIESKSALAELAEIADSAIRFITGLDYDGQLPPGVAKDVAALDDALDHWYDTYGDLV